MHRSKLPTSRDSLKLKRLAVSNTLSLLAIYSVDVVDVAFISWTGTQADVAALSIGVAIAALVNMLSLAAAQAAGIWCAAKTNDTNAADRVFAQVSITGAALTLLVCAGCLTFLSPIASAFSTSNDVGESVKLFVWILIPSSAAVTLVQCGNYFLRTRGDMTSPVKATMAIAGANIIFDAVFVAGVGMGISGVALGTVLARSIGLVLVILYVFRSGFSLQLTRMRELRLRRYTKSIISLLLNNVLAPVSSIIILFFLTSHGDEVVAAYGVATRIAAFSFCIVFTVPGILGPLLGQPIAKKSFDGVVHVVMQTFIFSGLGLTTAWVVLNYSSDPIALAFVLNGVGRATFDLYLLISLPIYLSTTVTAMSVMILTSVTADRLVAITMLFRVFAVLTPAIYIGNITAGAQGILAMEAVVHVLGAVFLGLISYSKLNSWAHRALPKTHE